jgi:hypothetical protein
MKFTIAAEALKDAVKDAASVADPKSTHPAFGLFLVRSDDPKCLTVTATDGAQRLEVLSGAEVSVTGGLCISAANLADNAAQMRGTVAASLEGDGLVLDDGFGATVLNPDVMRPDQYPPGDDDLAVACSFRAKGAVLASLLRSASISVNTNAVPGQLDGAAFDVSGDDLGILASDGKSVVFARTKVESPTFGKPETTRFVGTMAETAVKTAVELLKRAREDVTVSFTVGRGTIVTPLFKYSFPLTNYSRQLPWRDGHANVPTEGPGGTFDTRTLLAAVQRAYACIREDAETQAVTVAIEPSGATVCSGGRRGKSRACCPVAEFHGAAPSGFRVSGKLLGQHLRNFGEGAVRLVVTPNVVALNHDNVVASLALMVNAPEPAA